MPGPGMSAPARLSLTSVKLRVTVRPVKIRNFAHKGLKRLYSEDSAKGVPPDTVDKLRKMLAYLDDMENPEELWALAFVEGAHADRRPEGYMEPQRHPQPASDVPHRQRRPRNLRCEFGRLPLGQKEKTPCP